MEKDCTVFTIRRLFKEDMERIKEYSSNFDFLHFNPLNEEYIWHILLEGAFWAVFDGQKVVSVTYLLPADSTAFTQLNAAWNVIDLLDCSLENTLLCGYVHTDSSYADRDIYTALSNLWTVQAARRGRSQMIHFMPAHIDFDMERLLNAGFELVGLRGLDNLVPHYIFTKAVSFEKIKTQPGQQVEKCKITETKIISMLCEHNYRGFDMDVEKNILFRR